MHTWLIHTVVQQKLSQHGKGIIPQFKKEIKIPLMTKKKACQTFLRVVLRSPLKEFLSSWHRVLNPALSYKAECSQTIPCSPPPAPPLH